MYCGWTPRTTSRVHHRHGTFVRSVSFCSPFVWSSLFLFFSISSLSISLLRTRKMLPGFVESFLRRKSPPPPTSITPQSHAKPRVGYSPPALRRTVKHLTSPHRKYNSEQPFAFFLPAAHTPAVSQWAIIASPHSLSLKAPQASLSPAVRLPPRAYRTTRFLLSACPWKKKWWLNIGRSNCARQNSVMRRLLRACVSVGPFGSGASSCAAVRGTLRYGAVLCGAVQSRGHICGCGWW